MSNGGTGGPPLAAVPIVGRSPAAARIRFAFAGSLTFRAIGKWPACSSGPFKNRISHKTFDPVCCHPPGYRNFFNIHVKCFTGWGGIGGESSGLFE